MMQQKLRNSHRNQEELYECLHLYKELSKPSRMAIS